MVRTTEQKIKDLKGEIEELEESLIKETTEWKCMECDDLHKKEKDALECCASAKRECVDVYLCPDCEDSFESKNDARECCR